MPEFQLYIEGPNRFRSRMKVFDVRRTERRLDFVSGRCPRNKRRHREATEGGRLSRSFGKGRVRRNRECQAKAARSNTSGLDGIIEVLATVDRIRERAAVGDRIPVVFWVEDIDEGEEVAVGGNVHLMRPDSFNQLRGLLARLLDQSSRGRDEFAT